MTVADLTYRNYDGPLDRSRSRWWTIARHGIRLALKKRSMYFASLASAWYYLVMIIVLFIVEQLSASVGEAGGRAARSGVEQFVDRLVWKDQFLHGFSFAQLILMLVTLLLGAGAVANDNRANALLVYLSKPCTKADYLLGKFLGVFIPLSVVMAVPTVAFYAYGALSLRGEGFLDDPWILPRMLLIIAISSAFQSSLVVGVSSMFNQGRIAGAAYAGIYFLSNFFTKLIQVVIAVADGKSDPRINDLTYLSVDGLQIGLAKAILRTDGTPPFGIQGRMSSILAPSVWPMLVGMILIGGGAMLIAARRVRAVEVVG